MTWLGDVSSKGFALSRAHIIGVALSGSLLFSYLITGRCMVRLAFVVALDWMVVNLLNKVTDWKEDAVNDIPHHKIAASSSMLILVPCLVVLGASLWYNGINRLFYARVVGHLLGFVYNFRVIPWVSLYGCSLYRLKDTYHLKNLASCTGFLITLFLYPIVANGGLPEETRPSTIFALMAFFAPLEICFEIMFDIRDVEGDRIAKCNSYPVVDGLRWSKRLILVLEFLSLLSLAFGFATNVLQFRHVVLGLGPVIQFAGLQLMERYGYTEENIVKITWTYCALQLIYLVIEHTMGSFEPIVEITTPRFLLPCLLLIGWLQKIQYSHNSSDYWWTFGCIAAAAVLAENSAIEVYHYYQYDASWELFIGQVPVHVILIWPQVIMGEYNLLKMNLKLRGWPVVLFGCIDVFNMAFVIEFICVNAGLWTWKLPNIWGVPLIGCMGWALFAGGIFACLEFPTESHIANTLRMPFVASFWVHFGVIAFWELKWNKLIEGVPIDPKLVLEFISFFFMFATVIYHGFPGLKKAANITLASEFPRLIAYLTLTLILIRTGPHERRVEHLVFLFLFSGFGLTLPIGYPSFLREQAAVGKKES